MHSNKRILFAAGLLTPLCAYGAIESPIPKIAELFLYMFITYALCLLMWHLLVKSIKIALLSFIPMIMLTALIDHFFGASEFISSFSRRGIPFIFSIPLKDDYLKNLFLKNNTTYTLFFIFVITKCLLEISFILFICSEKIQTSMQKYSKRLPLSENVKKYVVIFLIALAIMINVDFLLRIIW